MREGTGTPRWRQAGAGGLPGHTDSTDAAYPMTLEPVKNIAIGGGDATIPRMGGFARVPADPVDAGEACVRNAAGPVAPWVKAMPTQAAFIASHCAATRS